MVLEVLVPTPYSSSLPTLPLFICQAHSPLDLASSPLVIQQPLCIITLYPLSSNFISLKMSSLPPVYIVSTARTPVGSFLG